MKKEEIEAARGWIRNALLLSELPTIDKAWAALDALCAAARQPENTQGFDDWLDASPEWVGQINRLEDTGHKQLVRRAMQAAWGAAREQESLVGKIAMTVQQKAWWPSTKVRVVADQGDGTYLVEPIDSPGGLAEFRGCDLQVEGNDAE